MAFSNTDWSLLQVSQWLRKFLFHDITYLLVFVGVFHLHKFTDIVTTVFPTLSFWDGCALIALFFVLCCSAWPVTVPESLHVHDHFFSSFANSFFHFLLLQHLLGWHNGRAAWIFFFLKKDFVSYIAGTSNKRLGKANIHHFLRTYPCIF